MNEVENGNVREAAGLADREPRQSPARKEKGGPAAERQDRTIAGGHALAALKASDNPESGAEWAINARSRGARNHGRSITDVDAETARRMAREDLDDLRKFKTPERLDDAAVLIHDNMRNPAYKAEFERADFEAAKGVELLAQQAVARVARENPNAAALAAEDVTIGRRLSG